MTFDELIQRYRLQIEQATNKTAAVENILYDLNRITYTNGKLLSRNHKLYVLDNLRTIILDESFRHYDAHDNSEYIKLIEKAMKSLGGK